MTMVDAVLSTYERVTDRTRKDKAFRAAEQQYGDMTGDPGLFSALEGIEMRRAQESDRAEAHDQNINIRGNQETRAQGEYDFQMESAEVEQREAAILNMVEALRSARDRGEDVGEAFDGFAETLPKMGVSEDDIPKLRDELVANPNLLDDYYKALSKGEKRKAVKSGSDSADAARSMRIFSDVVNRIDLIESEEMAAVGPDVFGLPGIGKALRSGGFGALGAVPGSSASDFVSNLEALRSDVRSQAFETLKGGGQITEKESQFAAEAISRMERTTSYAEFQRELKRLRSYMNALQAAANKRANGEVVGEVQWPTDKVAGAGEVDREGRSSEIAIGTIIEDPETGLKFRVTEDGLVLVEDE